ncbi:wax ester/triacylglycerol synthase family O-acyltransferase [Herbiconiux daphne]|uniref:Wax ester/triacylglycerol synthase family O-acyltransferase n=1 Tax=Herbiconiux daphne TaxID=2970914 RepID=A0ABT2H0L3_9MICO|nr:wax ester/triacylglycerol synthase family O-acyltransferase [Herbiconiux daphne]MCS5733379.1 wax ester/triacylglycerol synthase family O-acyltransferase [Herbiconiux daphne]
MSAQPHAEFMQIWEEGYVSNHISFANMQSPALFVLEGAPMLGPDGRLDRPAIRAYVNAAFASNPAFRVRLLRPFLGLTPPAWVPDDDFELDRHIVFDDDEVDLAGDDLRRLGGAYDGTMSLRHPLWRLRFTRLRDGDVAMGLVVHHASLDGMSGMKLFRGICQKSWDAPPPPVRDPFAGVRAPARWELPGLAVRQWRARVPGRRAAWKDFRAKPFRRRVRRVAARLLLPLRYGAGGAEARERMLPPIHSAYRRLDAAQVGRRARELGGTVSDLQVASIIGAWPGSERVVRLRFPVSFHSPDAPEVRNHVRDMEVTGDADAPLTSTMRSVHDQVADRAAFFAGRNVPGFPIGYSTLLPWVSRPQFFCGAEVKAMIPFPASLGRDQLAAAGVMYNGSLFVGANMPASRDVDATVERIASLMGG